MSIEAVKKEQVADLFNKGNPIPVIAEKINEPIGYVSYLLQQLGYSGEDTDFLSGSDKGLYHRFFKSVLQIGTPEVAKKSIDRIDSLYCYFETIGDRAGQHQAMVLALTGMNKARWSGKTEISELFREWIARH